MMGKLIHLPWGGAVSIRCASNYNYRKTWGVILSRGIWVVGVRFKRFAAYVAWYPKPVASGGIKCTMGPQS